MMKPRLPYDGRMRITKLYGTAPPTGVHYSTGKHSGIDIVGVSDKTLRAVLPGTVYRVGFDPSGWGRYVVIRQTDDMFAIYCHLSKTYVQAGAAVTQGQKIGLEGSTGQVTGRHCHFELRKSYANKYSTIDPAPYLGVKNKVGEVEEVEDELAKIIQVKVQLPSGTVKNVDGILQAGTNYVALRQVLEAMGYKVGWANNTVIIDR